MSHFNMHDCRNLYLVYATSTRLLCKLSPSSTYLFASTQFYTLYLMLSTKCYLRNHDVIYENLVFIKYLIHKVNGSILFCLHNHNEQFTMEPVLFENHKLDCLIPKVKSWLFTHKILKGVSRWN